jgi:hypothetical protein
MPRPWFFFCLGCWSLCIQFGSTVEPISLPHFQRRRRRRQSRLLQVRRGRPHLPRLSPEPVAFERSSLLPASSLRADCVIRWGLTTRRVGEGRARSWRLTSFYSKIQLSFCRRVVFVPRPFLIGLMVILWVTFPVALEGEDTDSCTTVGENCQTGNRV